MMDSIERKSWALSLAIHVALVLISLFGIGIPVLALRSASPPPQPVPAPRATGEVVLAPESVDGGSGSLPPLPSLSASPLRGIQAIVPAPTNFPGKERSRGDSPGQRAPVELPQASAAPTPMSDALRGQHANPQLSAEAANRATAADHIDFIIKRAYPKLWRGFATQITNRNLFIEIIADERGIIRQANLFHCTTGVPDLDRAITDWLVQQGTNVPRLPAGQPLRFVVVLP
jgi:hypothetical protein